MNIQSIDRAKKGLAVYIILCVLYCCCSIFWGNSNVMQAVIYGTSASEKEGIVIGEQTVLDTEFTSTVDKIEGFSVYYYDNEQEFDDEKLHFEVWMEGESKVVKSGTLELSQQTDDTTVFLPCPLSDIKGKKIKIHIYGEGIKGNDGPMLAVTENAVEESTLFVNGDRQNNVLHFSLSYLTSDRKIAFRIVKGICLILIGILVYGLIYLGEMEPQKKGKGKKKNERNKKTKINVKMVLGYVITMLFIFMVLEFTYTKAVEEASEKQIRKEMVGSAEDGKYIPLQGGQEISQNIICEGKNMCGIGIFLLAEDKKNLPELTMTISKDETVLVRETYKLDELLKKQSGEKETEAVKLKFPVISDKFTSQKIRVTWRLGNTENFRMNILTTQEGDVVCEGYFKEYRCLKSLFYVLAGMICVIVTVIFYGSCTRKWDADKMFFLAVLLWGMVYCGVLTVYSVPDEPSHIDTAYRISNQMLGIKDLGVSHSLYKRLDDIDPNPTEKTDVSSASYKKLYEELFTQCDRTELKETYVRNNLGNAPSICYYAPAFGISVGRILGLGTMPMLLLGRLCSLLAAALLMYFGVKKLPYGKTVFYVIGLLPITLQEIMSFSYDSFLIGLSYLFAGYFFAWIYGQQKLKIYEGVILITSLLLLAVAKGGVYMPLVGLVFLFPMCRREKRRSRIIFCFMTCIAAVTAYVVKNPTILSRLGIVKSSLSSAGGQEAMYSLGYFINNPLKFIRIFENTIYEKLDIYLSGILGGRLGWLNIHISWYIVIAFAVMLVLAAACRERAVMEKGQQVWVLLLCGMCGALIFLSMLIAGTPVGENIILGVQGRYFLPLLGIAFMALPMRKFVYREQEPVNFIFAGAVLQVLVISQILISVL